MFGYEIETWNEREVGCEWEQCLHFLDLTLKINFVMNGFK